jgi:hypothetical protein
MKKQLQRHEEELKHPVWMDDLMKEVNKVNISASSLLVTHSLFSNSFLDPNFREEIRALPIGLGLSFSALLISISLSLAVYLRM